MVFGYRKRGISLVDAAVAIIYKKTKNDRIEILFIKRTINLGDPWSGHIAFPGGRYSEEDNSLLDTVYREVKEEINLDLLKYGKLIARLEKERSLIRRNLIIHPFLFYLLDDAQKLIGNQEVDKIFWIPIDELKHSKCRRYLRDTESYWMVYCYRWRKDIVIWGVTYRILYRLLEKHRDLMK